MMTGSLEAKASAKRWQAPTLTRGLVAGLLLAGGAVNGLVAQAEGNWRIEGAGTILAFFGFGFFVPFSIWVAVKLIASAGNAVPRGAVGLVAILYALAVLAPSSLVAWGAVLLYAAVLACFTRGGPRWGALIFVCLAGVVIWTSAAIKAVSLQVTAFDAAIVEQILHALGRAVTRQGNLLTEPSGHDVLILMDCATLKRLPLALLSCVSASLLSGNLPQPRRLARWLPLIALGLVAMNAVRLTLLSLSPAAYDLVHGDVGKSIYDALETLVVIWAGLLMGERGGPDRPSWRGRVVGRVLAEGAAR